MGSLKANWPWGDPCKRPGKPHRVDFLHLVHRTVLSLSPYLSNPRVSLVLAYPFKTENRALSGFHIARYHIRVLLCTNSTNRKSVPTHGVVQSYACYAVNNLPKNHVYSIYMPLSQNCVENRPIVRQFGLTFKRAFETRRNARFLGMLACK